jgi:hypothetical protein
MRLTWSTSVTLALLLACSYESGLDTEQTSGGGDSSTEIDAKTTSGTPEPTTGGPTSQTTFTTEDPTTQTSDEPAESTGLTTESTSPDTTDTSTGTSTGTTGESTDTSTGTTVADTDTSTGTTEPPESCVDGLPNGDETDVDCGGDVCDPCDDGQMCVDGDDCASSSCDGTCQPAACDDGIVNGAETDVDCGGGDCGPCEDGELCVDGDDCVSGVCEAQMCQLPACDDGAINGDETDVDCGGIDCGPCDDGAACLIDDDCASQVCEGDQCAAPACDDGVQNGEETAVDCGGPGCLACQVDHLILNEVDYDQPGQDNQGAEFIEIWNNTGATVSLAGLRVVLVNGANNQTYANIDLSGAVEILDGQYLVVAPAAFAVPQGVLKVNTPGANDQIQNGAPSPDGVALVDTVNLKLIDALSYEGSLTSGNVTGLGMGINLVEGTATPAVDNGAAGSLARLPNGTDTDDAAADWAFTATLTPGLPNVP